MSDQLITHPDTDFSVVEKYFEKLDNRYSKFKARKYDFR